MHGVVRGTLILGLVACATSSPSSSPSPQPPPSPSPVVTEPVAVTFVRGPEPAAAPPIACETMTGHRRLLTLDWKPAERAALMAGLARGLVVVRLVGCDLALLPRCRVPAGSYVYTPRAPLEYTRTFAPGSPEWVVNLPRWASSRSAKELTFDVFTVGEYHAAPIDVRRAARVGDCDGATHVVGAVEVGNILEASEPGGYSGCSSGHFADTQPPPQCSKPWSVQLTALDPHAPVGPQCPAPLRWNGLYCDRERGEAMSHTCVVASPGHPGCKPHWPEPPPEDPRRVLLPARLDRTMIDAALESVRAAFSRCGPAGARMQLRLRVEGTTGRVLAARALGRESDGPLARCAVEAAADARLATTVATEESIDVTLQAH